MCYVGFFPCRYHSCPLCNIDFILLQKVQMNCNTIIAILYTTGRNSRIKNVFNDNNKKKTFKASSYLLIISTGYITHI